MDINRENHCSPYTLFLDIDGVLNKESDWNKGLYTLNNECIKNFIEYLGKLQNYQIVLISTWRNGDGINKLKSYFSIYDSTPNGGNKGRQREIEYYIKRHNIKDYIIIDDDISLYYAPEKINIYIPNYKTGLQKQDVKLLLKRKRK